VSLLAYTACSGIGGVRMPQTRTRSSDHAPAAENRPPSAITCRGCENWWTGLSSAHCSACHITFTGIYAFDMHRRGGRCADPNDIDLVPALKPWSGWSRPGTWRGPDDDEDYKIA
jgi:hypothetical protein